MRESARQKYKSDQIIALISNCESVKQCRARRQLPSSDSPLGGSTSAGPIEIESPLPPTEEIRMFRHRVSIFFNAWHSYHQGT